MWLFALIEWSIVANPTGVANTWFTIGFIAFIVLITTTPIPAIVRMSRIGRTE